MERPTEDPVEPTLRSSSCFSSEGLGFVNESCRLCDLLQLPRLRVHFSVFRNHDKIASMIHGLSDNEEVSNRLQNALSDLPRFEMQ